ncbi:MAG: hypothetical protein GC136_10280 [Alphaproteobacteria bacterium]|nr:hypothetical protein [Alphaproteobacteria bacterium]
MAQPLTLSQLSRKAKVLRVLAAGFAIIGLMMFSYLALTKVSGEGLLKLLNPDFILVLLVPFLPAFILSALARKTEKKIVNELAKREKEAATAK